MFFFTRALVALGACLVLSGTLLAGEALPRPAGLEPDIAFWRRIFAECTTQQGLIHDNRNLSIVYEKLDFTSDASQARIQKVAKAARNKYERILRKLGTGKRKGLSAEERRVLKLWPADVTDRELRAAAERVRFQQGLADRFHAGLVRSGQWRSHIRQTLRSAGVPEELEALPHVESSFDPSARSFVGAAGLWQFTGDTGRRFMRIDQVVDERRDPYESSEAAAQLLKYNYSILNTWPLAITAYNHGSSGMRRAVNELHTDDIETIVRHYDGRAFGFASRNFYVSFLAALDIEKSPEEYFGPVRRKKPRPEVVVKLPDYLRADTLEKVFGVSRSTLQSYNPALLPPVWDGAKYVPRGFRLRLPGDGVIDAAPKQLLAAIPASQRFDRQVPDKTYKVRRGDTLSHIARRYHTSVAKLARANGISRRNRIRIGQKLKLPVHSANVAPVRVAKAKPAPAKVKVNLAPISVARAESELPEPPASPEVPDSASPDAADLPAVDSPDASTAPDGEGDGTSPSLADPSDYLVADNDTVEVQASETLSHYADWLNVSVKSLRRANGWSRRHRLLLGQRLRLVFSNVSHETFVARRVAYHRSLQEDFFSSYRIIDTTEHKLRRGESVWVLASRKYKIPVWLLRQYNPKLDLDDVRPGMVVIFPRITKAI